MKKFIKLFVAAGAYIFILSGVASAAEQTSVATPASGVAYQLKDSIDLALKHNPNFKSLQEYHQSASFDRSRARSGFLPSLSASAGVGFEQWSDSDTRSGSPNTQWQYTYHQRTDATARLTQSLWDGFNAWSSYNMSDATLNAAKYSLFDNAESLTLHAIITHMDVCRHQKMVQLSEINVNNHRRVLGSQTERVKAGASTQADVTQTQTRLAIAETALVDAKLDLDTAVHNYKNLTGQIPGQLVPASAPTETFSSLEGALTSGFSNNSQIISKISRVEAAMAQSDLYKSAFHPRVYLEASYRYTDQPQSSSDYSWGTSAMLRGQWNLFNGGYDWYNVKGADARTRQAGMELQGLRDNLIKETSYAWSEWQSAVQQVKLFSNAVVYNTQTRDMYMQQFNVGSRSLLDVLNSENELYSTSKQLISAQQNELAVQYRLLTLAGKLLDALGIDKDSLTPETVDTEED